MSKPTDPVDFKVPDKEFSMDEVKKHNKKDDLWIVVKGIVLDVTNWLDEHPGGPQALFSHMGKDATEGKLASNDTHIICSGAWLILRKSSRCYTMTKSYPSTLPILSLVAFKVSNLVWKYNGCFRKIRRMIRTWRWNVCTGFECEYELCISSLTSK